MSRPADKIARSIRAIFNKNGYWCQHISADLNPGIPDLLACGKEYYWIEVKSLHDVNQPSQNAWVSFYKKMGGINWFRVRELNFGFELESSDGNKNKFKTIIEVVSWILEVKKGD